MQFHLHPSFPLPKFNLNQINIISFLPTQFSLNHFANNAGTKAEIFFKFGFAFCKFLEEYENYFSMIYENPRVPFRSF